MAWSTGVIGKAEAGKSTYGDYLQAATKAASASTIMNTPKVVAIFGANSTTSYRIGIDFSRSLPSAFLYLTSALRKK